MFERSRASRASRSLSLAAVLSVLAALLEPATSHAQDGPTFTATLPGGVTMDFVRIPAGTFAMGLDEPPGSAWHTCEFGLVCNQPVHSVTIGYDLFVGVYEVTQAQWVAMMGTNPTIHHQDNAPVEATSWEDSNAFTDALNRLGQGVYRLPSEAEWEYAARAGTTTRFFFGDGGTDCQPQGSDRCAVLSEYAWWGANSSGWAQPVGQLRPNAFGLFDVYGNVYEWCLDDETSSYDGAPTDGRPWITEDDDWKILRGSWDGYSDARRYTSAFRAGHQNWFHLHHDCCGLRVVREIDPKQLRLVTTRVPPAVACKPYLYALQAVAGVEPYRFSIVSGSLPTGLALNEETGEISGTARQIVRGVVSVRVGDVVGAADGKDFLVKAIPADLPVCRTVDSLPECQGAGPSYAWSSEELNCDAILDAGADGGGGGQGRGGCSCSVGPPSDERLFWLPLVGILAVHRWLRRRFP